MKIELKQAYNHAYWRIKHNDGTDQYVMGIDQMAEIIENAEEPIELEPSQAYQEHSKLIELIKQKNEKNKRQV